MTVKEQNGVALKLGLYREEDGADAVVVGC